MNMATDEKARVRVLLDLSHSDALILVGLVANGFKHISEMMTLMITDCRSVDEALSLLSITATLVDKAGQIVRQVPYDETFAAYIIVEKQIREKIDEMARLAKHAQANMEKAQAFKEKARAN